MNTEKFTYLLAHPGEIEHPDLIQLEMMIQRHPFFQSARALLLKGLKNRNSYRYNDMLKVTAAHTSDRDILFQYITSEEFVQNEISLNIIQNEEHIRSLTVVSEDVSLDVSLEKEQFEQEKQKANAILNPNLFERKEREETSDVSPIPENLGEELTSQPLEFSDKDRYSFSEWLKLSKAQPVKRKNVDNIESSLPQDESKMRQSLLIEKFIQEKPRITPELPSPENRVSQESLVKNFMVGESPKESLMTETLAKVYLQQKNYKKSIQAYKILILKYPEKSGYFADQIRAIEKLINPENS